MVIKSILGFRINKCLSILQSRKTDGGMGWSFSDSLKSALK